MKVKLKNVRLSFPELFTPKSFSGEESGAYSANFLFKPDSTAHKAILDAMQEVAADKWGAKGQAQLAKLISADKVALHDGNTKSYSGYEGMLFLSARSSVRPLVIDSDKTPLQPSDGRPYSGCYVNATIEIYAQDNAYGKRVNASLGGVQFYRDGEAFAGGRSASIDDFDDVSDEDEEDFEDEDASGLI